jgi:3-mercaptopyruvate sulfurtransferase SseA
MRSTISLAAATLAFALLAACSPQDGSAPATNATTARNSAASVAKEATPQTPAPQEPGSDVRRITQDDVRAGMQNGTVALFDVRDKPSYEAGHIKGAKLVPWDQVANRLGEFPKDKLVVTYCA